MPPRLQHRTQRQHPAERCVTSPPVARWSGIDHGKRRRCPSCTRARTRVTRRMRGPRGLPGARQDPRVVPSPWSDGTRGRRPVVSACLATPRSWSQRVDGLPATRIVLAGGEGRSWTMATAAASDESNVHLVSWVALTIIVGLVLPGGGFLVAAVSQIRRIRDRSPRLSLLLMIAAAVLVVQIVGLLALPSHTAGTSPPQVVS